MAEKGKKAGIGAGLFGGAGLFALYGLGCLIAAAILGLAGPVPDWLAAIIVGVSLFASPGLPRWSASARSRKPHRPSHKKPSAA